MTTSLSLSQVEALIRLAIDEDIKGGDVTSRAIFSATDQSHALIRAKGDGVFCGEALLTCVYALIDPTINVAISINDRGRVSHGDLIAEITGSTIGILEGERIALNFIQRMSGIATKTARMVEILHGSDIEVLDTRKTLPGFRLIDKYSVLCGGGKNHRMGLHDMVMIKDNHIKAAGSITRAVEIVRKRHGKTYKVEVETTTTDEVAEAREAGADIIMLDNMDRLTMEQAIDNINGEVKIEISGNMDESRLYELRDLKVDFISIGALTHSVTAFDLSMKMK